MYGILFMNNDVGMGGLVPLALMFKGTLPPSPHVVPTPATSYTVYMYGVDHQLIFSSVEFRFSYVCANQHTKIIMFMYRDLLFSSQIQVLFV